MSANKQIRLGVNVLASGRHDAAWKTLPNPETLSTDIDAFVAIAQTAERGLIDAIFLADTAGGLTEEAYHRPWRALEPVSLLAAIARETSHIGLVATTSSIFGHPDVVARQLASLDHISKGRAAWNIITSQSGVSLGAYGFDKGFSQAERYERATEFATVVTGLWDSVPAQAVVADAKTNIYLDAARLRKVDHKGRHFQSKGHLSAPTGPQGRPVIFQAGASEDSKAFGARWADALFTGQRTLDGSKTFYADVKALAKSYGRDPAKLLVMPGLFPIVGSTEAEANRRKEELDALLDHDYLLEELSERLGVDADDFDLDQPLPYELISERAGEDVGSRWFRTQITAEAKAKNYTTREVLNSNIVGGHRMIVGTPEQIADDIISWVDGDACDGFNLNIDVQTSGLADLVDHVIPVLQRAGRFRTEYTGQTLRDHLGL